MEDDKNNINLYQVNDDLCQDKVITTQLRQISQGELNTILNLIEEQHNGIFADLQSFGIPRNITRGFIQNIVSYVLQNERNYPGNLQQRTNQIYNDMSRSNGIFPLIRIYGRGGDGRANQIIRDIIELILLYLEQGAQPPRSPRPPSPGPVPPSRRQWSSWEDLGGIIESAPAVSSWQRNRLDVFARGQDQGLWHLFWDGSRWSNWESLGGIITSAPAAASWGPNRIDVFAIGQNQSLWHLYWDGSRWSDWEDLGGVLLYSPTVA